MPLLSSAATHACLEGWAWVFGPALSCRFVGVVEQRLSELSTLPLGPLVGLRREGLGWYGDGQRVVEGGVEPSDGGLWPLSEPCWRRAR